MRTVYILPLAAFLRATASAVPPGESGDEALPPRSPDKAPRAAPRYAARLLFARKTRIGLPRRRTVQ